MAKEIERKFLVKDCTWKSGRSGLLCSQGYLAADEEVTVRVRIIGVRAYLTVKGRTQGMTRDEFEYEIDVEDADIMLHNMAKKGTVVKMRYKVESEGMIWEVDEFLYDNEGLILAEIELEREDQEIALPEWIGDEVTGDVRYNNSSLALHPFSRW